MVLITVSLRPFLVLTFITMFESFATSDFESDSESLCDRQCKGRLIGSICKTTKKDNTTVITEIDLRNCTLKSIGDPFFSTDPQVQHNLSQIITIRLNENPLPNGSIAKNVFRQMDKLDLLFLPKLFGECPGGEEAWEGRNSTPNGALCYSPLDFCDVLIHENQTQICPPNSECKKDGPGLVSCDCKEGYYGYKCLRKGTFPFALFYSVLSSATVILSVLLWYTQRRHVKKAD